MIIKIFLQVTVDRYYRLGTKGGPLKYLYLKSQFEICSINLITIEQVPKKNTFALRKIATQQSTKTGQGFIKFTCKNNILCTSKCHTSTI